MVAEEKRDFAALQRAARKLGWEGLLQIVADVYGVSAADIRSRDRAKTVTDARQMYYFVLYEFLYWSNAAIARVGERNNSSISHGLACMRRRLEQSEVRHALDMIEQDILAKSQYGTSLHSVGGGRS